MKIRIKKIQRGMYLPIIMIASVLFMAYATALISISMSNVAIANLHNKKITSMSIAEAGINYYMWHLAHSNTDYCDGSACTETVPYGPYHHEYQDQYGNTLGTFDLYITPPMSGGAITTVKSVGKVAGRSPIRSIIAELGMPSFTKYTLLSNNSQLWIGSGEKVTGSVFVNGSGMYNEGEITGDAYSTETTYNGWFGNQPGVSGPGVFGGAKIFPVPRIDFEDLGVDILNLRNGARDQGEGQYYGASNQKGYHILLQADNYKLYRVRRYDNNGFDIAQEDLLGTYEYPAQGIIFVQDNLWVNGTINNKKVTIIAADPEAGASQQKRIIIPNLVKYTNFDGTDKLGLITQTNILVSKNAPFDMEIDAAMIAKNGQIKINYYNQIKGNMKVYGSMAHNTGLVWTYANMQGTVVSGYRTTETIMDNQNVLNPPPKFPTTGSYSILSWREE